LKHVSKYFILLFAIFLLCVALLECITVNSMVFNMFNDSDLNKYHFLKDGVESENYEILPLPDPFPPTITYNPEHNFFLVEFLNSIKKLDGKGEEVFSIKKGENIELPNFAHYVFTRNGVYDTTKSSIIEESFKEIVNKNRDMKEKEWNKRFIEFFKSAQEVVYGKEYSMKQDGGFSVYFKTGEGWINLITNKKETRSTDDNALEYTFKGAQARYQKMVILKDPYHETFSDQETIEMMLQEKNPENYKLKYTNQKKIRVRYFKKAGIYEEIAFTPIPILSAGTAIYQIKMKDDVLTFKENAIKPFIGSVQNHFHWYILPDPYFHNSEVSFLELKYPSNWHESGSNGMYIIRRKKGH